MWQPWTGCLLVNQCQSSYLTWIIERLKTSSAGINFRHNSFAAKLIQSHSCFFQSNPKTWQLLSSPRPTHKESQLAARHRMFRSKSLTLWGLSIWGVERPGGVMAGKKNDRPRRILSGKMTRGSQDHLLLNHQTLQLLKNQTRQTNKTNNQRMMTTIASKYNFMPHKECQKAKFLAW